MDSNMATLYGGSELTVTYRDGRTEVVKVRQLIIDDYPKLLKVLDDEPAQIDFVCDRPNGWSNTLALESFEAVLQEGDKLNEAFFTRWLQRRMNKQEKLLPGLGEKIQNQVVTSLSSAPKSQSPPAGPARRSPGAASPG